MRPLLSAVVVVLAAALPAAGQDAGVRVQRTGAPHVQAAPGQRVTGVFRVSRAVAGERIRLTVDLPDGWTGLSSAPPAGAQSFIHLVPLSVPIDARAGRYAVRLTAEAGGRRSADSLVVEVPEMRAVTLTVTHAPRFAAAGTFAGHTHPDGDVAAVGESRGNLVAGPRRREAGRLRDG